MNKEKVIALNTVPRPKEWDGKDMGAERATPKQIREQLKDLEITFPGRLSAQEVARRDDLYCLYLAPLTELELRAACERYAKSPDSEHFPRPGRLLALARRW
jgi:hypothetical protein